MDALEKLKKRLYKSKEEFKEREREEMVIKKEKIEAPSEWKEPVFEKPEDVMAASKEITAYLKKRKARRVFFLFGGIIAILLILVASLVYKFYIRGGGLGFLSAENIYIEIKGPTNIKAGERAVWSALIKNRNKISLENANLIIEYPEMSEPSFFTESRSPFGPEDRLLKIETRELGSIGAESEIEESFETFVFGEENSGQKIKISLEYRLKDSSAIFEKSSEKDFIISEPAVTIFLEAPKEIGAGKKINFKADIISNTPAVLKNLILDIEYPAGFEFEDSLPGPSEDNSRWRIGDLLSGEKKTVNISGKILLKTFVQEQTIRALVGVLDENKKLKIYSKKIASLEIKKPFLDIVSKINGGEEYAGQTGETLKVDLEWTNNLPVGIKNAVIEAKIQGEAIDLTSLSIESGVYRSFDGTIVWNNSTFPKFSYLESGEEGKVSFSIKIKKSLPVRNEGDRNFSVDFGAKFFTSLIPEEYVNVEIAGVDKKTVKIISDFQFVQRGLFYSGPFKNSGPLPPAVGKTTTYTIVWSLINSYNDLNSVRISAVLPNYIQWQNQISPQINSGKIFFNSETREVVWTPGRLEAGIGIIRPAEEISFQILFLPGEPHLGSAPVLISKATAEAKDDFTGAELKVSQPAIITELRDDPQIGRGKGTVAK